MDTKLEIIPSDELILRMIEEKVATRKEFLKLHRKIAEEFKVVMLTSDQLVQSYHKLIKYGKIKPEKNIEDLIRLKGVRSMSGIVVVSVLTKPYDCPGKCLYCPTEKGLPKSYMKNEPAVMRAIANKFDPYEQTTKRLEALRATGHPTDKINIRVIGGTWSYYPRAYQTWFIKQCFQACNEFGINQKTKIKKQNDQNDNDKESRNCLEDMQKKNERAECRIVEISIETRQDYIDKDELRRLRKLGVTKVELGVQSIYDDVLELNRRGHDNKKTIKATKLLKDAGFKVAYQIMLNLPGSTRSSDERMLEKLFDDEKYKPDYLKIYPLAIVKEAPVYKMYEAGEVKPYSAEELKEIISNFKEKVPCYLRIERVIRDIPSEDIAEGGAKISNLRQLIQEDMKGKGKRCNCIRCREVGANKQDEMVMLVREDYAASGGREIFLSIENKDRTNLYSILRLRIPGVGEKIFPAIAGAALVREIHTYGLQVPVGKTEIGASQHKGYGKLLLAEAERIVNEFKIKKMAIISGVGVREYFRKFGYELDDTYMVKNIF